MLEHTISISCYLEVVVVTPFCITKPSNELEVDLTPVQKTEKALLNYSLAILS